MKTDLLTSITAGIAGVLIAYFCTNLLIGPIDSFTYKTVNGQVDASLPEPNPEIFNYLALNPTVEVYVGECEEYNDYGECIDYQDEENFDNSNTTDEDTKKDQNNQEEQGDQEGQENQKGQEKK